METNDSRQIKTEPDRYRGADIIFEDAQDGDETANLCCPTPLSCFLSVVCPWSWVCACNVIPERQNSVILAFGEYVGTIKRAGIYIINPCGTLNTPVSVAQKSADIADIKCVDKAGNPMNISGVVTYKITNAKRAALDVDNPIAYVKTQALSVLKNVISRNTYDELKSQNDHVNATLIDELQLRVHTAGCTVLNFELTDTSYAKEIAQAMLVRQQAEATVNARKCIVEGATEIAYEAIKRLKARDLQLDPSNQGRLVSNLIVAICGESGVQPTLNLA